MDVIHHLLSDQVNATIITDGSGELTALHNVRRTANIHGYEVRTTASDESSQNGIVEQPHRTLKEKMRCILYSARLGTEFWADTMMHATWLYNQTYHSTIKMTPLQAYLGQTPAFNSIITFGAKITAKKPGMKFTATNPWTYDGIFLGYQNIMHNIRY